MARRMIVGEIQCDCGRYVNIRYIQTFNGESHTVKCWYCKRAVTLRYLSAFVEKHKAKKVTIIMDEVLKD